MLPWQSHCLVQISRGTVRCGERKRPQEGAGSAQRQTHSNLVFRCKANKVPTVTLNVVQQLLGRISQRTKLIAVGVIAFLLGLMFAGHGGDNGNGRYVPWGGDGLLDTRTGQIWQIDPESHRFRRWASLPYF